MRPTELPENSELHPFQRSGGQRLRNFSSQEFQLHNALIRTGEFESCTFERGNFAETIFEDVKFINCKFVNCNFDSTTFLRSKFSETSFESCALQTIKCVNSEFFNVNINTSNIGTSLIDDSCFEDCTLESLDFSNTDLRQLKFIRCNLKDTNFGVVHAPNFDFSYSQMAGAILAGFRVPIETPNRKLRYTGPSANLQNVKFIGSNLEHANLSFSILDGADFTGANLTDASLVGARWNEQTRFPE